MSVCVRVFVFFPRTPKSIFWLLCEYLLVHGRKNVQQQRVLAPQSRWSWWFHDLCRPCTDRLQHTVRNIFWEQVEPAFKTCNHEKLPMFFVCVCRCVEVILMIQRLGCLETQQLEHSQFLHRAMGMLDLDAELRYLPPPSSLFLKHFSRG